MSLFSICKMATNHNQPGPPSCGPYKTVEQVPIGGTTLEPGLLVYFHNHSEQGQPIILLPEKNENNRWIFQKRGYLLKDEGLISSLEALKPEGLYQTEHFHPNETEVVAKNALVQLGYTAKAEPLIFFPQPIEGKNGFVFSQKGLKIPDSIYELLDPVNTYGPFNPKKKHIHY